MKLSLEDCGDHYQLWGYWDGDWWYVLQIEKESGKVYLNGSVPLGVGIQLDPDNEYTIHIEPETR